LSSKLTNLALLLALSTVAITGQANAADTPENDSPQMQKAIGFHKTQKFREAAEAYRDVIREDPSNAKAHKLLGEVLAAQGLNAPDEKTRKDFDETAILEEKQAIKLDPKSYLPHVVLGKIYANRGQHEDAIKELKTAVSLKPDSFFTQIDLGVAYTHMGSSEEALAAYRRAAEIKPDKAVPFINMGVVQQSMGNYKDAIESEKKALTLQKSEAEKQAASLNLANIYADAGEPDNAIKYYQDANKINPQDLMPLSGIGWMQAAKGDYDAAIATQKVVLKRAGKDPLLESIARARMASAIGKKGQSGEAEKEFQKVISSRFPHPVAVMEYGYFLEQAGRKNEAKAQFQKALKIQPSFKPAKEALAKLDSGKTETK
jgi:Flp pilus assembly protein TadD